MRTYFAQVKQGIKQLKNVRLRLQMSPKCVAVSCVLSPRMTTGHGKIKSNQLSGTARPWQFDLRPGAKFINLKALNYET